MEPTAAVRGLRCRDCETVEPLDITSQCPNCGASRDVEYEYETVTSETLFASPSADGTAGAQGHWRFDALLPFAQSNAISAGEGDTPLVGAGRLADELGVERVYIKDEGRNPTGTVYDRGMSLAVTALQHHDDPADLEPVALATAGNSGQSAAAYLGQLGLRSYSFVPSRSAFSNKAMINVHGGQMRVVGGRYPDAAAAVDDQLATDYYSLQEFATPYRHEGAKTVAFELYDDLDDLPDLVFVPASTGELIAGVAKGFEELVAIGAAETTPTLVAVQPTSCAPIVAAVERGETAPEPWAVPDTIIGELEIPEPAGGTQAVAALDRLAGGAIMADDADSLQSAATIAQHEIIEMGAAGGAAAAGAWNWADDVGYEGDETVVILNTESGGKTPDILRSHLMGQGV